MEILKNPHFDLLGKARYFVAASLIVILSGLAYIAKDGLRYGVEFSGGIQLILKFASAPHVDRMDPRGAPLEQHVRESAGRRARVQGDQASRIDPERVERRGELVTAATHERIRLHDAQREGPVDQVAGLAIGPSAVTLARPDLAGEDQRLGPGARLGQAALDEELVETLAGGSFGSRAAHPAIVAQPSSPRLTDGGLGMTNSTGCDR